MRPLAPFVTVAFVTGAAVLAIELVVPRLLAPHAGVSLPVWTATIAVVLAGLAAGNALGGAWADRARGRAPDGVALLGAALAWAAAPPVLAGVARFVEAAPLSWRALLLAATTLPAFVLLGAVPTLLARAAVARDPGGAGRALGVLSAAGALGSLAGVYATGFALLPSLGLVAISRGVAVGLAVTGILRLATARERSAEEAPSPVPAAPRAAGTGLSAPCAAVLAFAAGAALLVVEVTGARAAARLVGSGIDTWTSVLGAVLLGLAAGSAVGGRMADGPSPRAAVGRLLLLSSVAVALSVWTPSALFGVARLDALPWPARLALGSLLAWGVPAFALGALSPALARAALPTAGGRGRAIGLVYAAGTAGAVLGALATAPLLCPLLGTRPTLVAVALGLVLLRLLAGARVEVPWAGALAALLVVALAPLDAARTAGAAMRLREAPDVYALESGYSTLRVGPVDPTRAGTKGRPGARVLTIDGFVHGLVDPSDPTWLGYGYEGIYDAVTRRVAPLPRPLRAFFVGGGAYVFPRHLVRTRAPVEIEVAEIDPAVTRAARETLGLAADPGFRIVHEDARTVVDAWRPRTRHEERWDLIYGDAFNDLSVPWHLATLEFARKVHDGLAEDGVYLLNVVDDPGAPRFVGAIVATLRRVFASVEVLGIDREPGRPETFVVVASDRALDLSELVRADPAGERAAGIPVVRYAPEEVDAFVERAGGLVLTDDFAPVEWLLAPVARARGAR
jgi:spermidine synthase